jgi:ubiquinol oxidase
MLIVMTNSTCIQLWKDRFLGYHCAILYYWLIVATYLYSPKVAYQFMELLEAHANDTYGEFVVQNEDVLRSIPPPDIAVSYYTGADLYQFDEFQVG